MATDVDLGVMSICIVVRDKQTNKDTKKFTIVSATSSIAGSRGLNDSIGFLSIFSLSWTLLGLMAHLITQQFSRSLLLFLFGLVFMIVSMAKSQ